MVQVGLPCTSKVVVFFVNERSRWDHEYMVKLNYVFMVSRSNRCKHFLDVGGVMEECGILNRIHMFDFV